MIAKADRRKPGWDNSTGTVTAVDTGTGTCTVTVRGVSLDDVSYLLPAPSVGDVVAIQAKGTHYYVIGAFAG